MHFSVITKGEHCVGVLTEKSSGLIPLCFLISTIIFTEMDAKYVTACAFCSYRLKGFNNNIIIIIIYYLYK